MATRKKDESVGGNRNGLAMAAMEAMVDESPASNLGEEKEKERSAKTEAVDALNVLAGALGVGSGEDYDEGEVCSICVIISLSPNVFD